MARNVPLVLCGDFNSDTNSAVYKLLASNRGEDRARYVGLNRDELPRDPFNILHGKISHNVILDSAYRTFGGKDPDFTNYTGVCMTGFASRALSCSHYDVCLPSCASRFRWLPGPCMDHHGAAAGEVTARDPKPAHLDRLLADCAPQPAVPLRPRGAGVRHGPGRACPWRTATTHTPVRAAGRWGCKCIQRSRWWAWRRCWCWRWRRLRRQRYADAPGHGWCRNMASAYSLGSYLRSRARATRAPAAASSSLRLSVCAACEAALRRSAVQHRVSVCATRRTSVLLRVVPPRRNVTPP